MAFKKIEIDETDHLLGYTHCECQVWPVVINNPISRCGKCLSKCYGIYSSEGIAQAAFNKFLEEKEVSGKDAIQE